MVELAWKSKMVSSDVPSTSPKLSNNDRASIPSPIQVADISPASTSACSAYENYLRLPELSKLWTSRDFPNWKNEPLIKPTLQALEITFRLISVFQADPRPYVNGHEWRRRLESLASNQIELIALLFEDGEEDAETHGTAPIVVLSTSNGVLARDGSLAEVWKIPGETPVVSRTSEGSLLPRLATWQKSEDMATKILFSIECALQRCPFTLGLGEPNLAGKPLIEYDLICRPSDLHSLKKSPTDHRVDNYENQALYSTNQILETWIRASRELLSRIAERIDGQDFKKAASDCWLLERIWKLLSDIEELHLMMDPDDFLRLKTQLAIKASSESEAFCFRSQGLIEITRASKDLKHKVPAILGVEVDPKGGPRIQEAAMKLYHGHGGGDFGRIHLLQALQAIESALKRFFFSYRQLSMIMMGSLEVKGNRGVVSADSSDALTQMFLEPIYFPSLDAAKTFLGDFWHYEPGFVTSNGSNARVRMKN